MTPETIDLRAIDLLDPDQDDDARAWIAVHRAARRALMGEDDDTWTLDEIRAFHRAGQKRRVVRGAWLEGELVGALEVVMPLRDNQSLATLWLSVRPDVRRRGVGSALYVEGEQIAREHGRTLLHAQTGWAPGGTDEGEGFARRRGFEIAMTDVRSSARPDADALRDILRRAPADDYTLESYVDDMPEEWLDDRAILQQRMITDMPLGDLTLEEEAWDAERLREDNALWRDAGRRVVETVARHVPSGSLVGFTQVSVSADDPSVGYQQDTLVLREHRGHGLGLRLKAANALLLLDALPEVKTIRTWNANDNAPMLSVNRALGYVVDGYSREWQKVLD